MKICVGDFELDLNIGELRNGDRKVLLGEQPFRILKMLAMRPGEVVTRQEIQDNLWPDGTIVEFDHSINVAIRRLRQVFGESADDRRYIETVRRQGYRLKVAEMVAPIDSLAVLGFASEGGPEMEFFSDRLTESITNHVASLHRLRVVPRITTLQYRASDHDVESLGRNLSVRALVSGRVALAKGHVVVCAELIDVSTASQLWGGRFRRRTRNMCLVRQEIAKEIFSCLRHQL
jgi:DNA-binding winged helix-turn-helix (wHTH) protein